MAVLFALFQHPPEYHSSVGDGFQPSRPTTGDRPGLMERTPVDAVTVRAGWKPAPTGAVGPSYVL